MKPEDKAVIQQALEAFETEAAIYREADPEDREPEYIWEAVIALSQLLEQPEQACPHGADSACKECHEAEQPAGYDRSIHSNPDAQAWAKFFLATAKEQNWSLDDIDEGLMIGWFANAMTAMHDHVKREQQPEQADEPDADELTIAYMDGMFQGKKIAKREVEKEASPGGVLFAVEEAIENGDCPFAIEIAFEAYEAERKALAGITQQKGTP